MTLRVVVLLLLLAGCGAPVPQFPREDIPTTTTTEEIISAAPTTTTTPPVPNKEVDFTTRFTMRRAACETGSPFNPTSEPYKGSGPHPFDVYEIPDAGGNVQHSSVVGLGSVRPTPNNVNHVRLIACVNAVLGARSGTVTCKFDKGVATSRTWPFHEATYRITVREARSGRTITNLPAAGDDTPEGSCPGFARDSAGTVVARSLTEDALGAAVSSLFKGPA
ncbi:hypothetical protein OG205_32915 [Lentzea sp. NBC_00516]|uniref:hypothetical protein n=1 Tax=Lentzea sp. NBC_00516 TaxID=2903582 RepID=UPI002E816603|nr:hypothetical protein [Lentzea sp. NBC_00516]WUD22845.1 hypothetical protein OG205_32915 [Lentzea sp. NBC_00516]